MYPSDRRPRKYPSGGSKKQAKMRKLEMAVASSEKMDKFVTKISSVTIRTAAQMSTDEMLPAPFSADDSVNIQMETAGDNCQKNTFCKTQQTAMEMFEDPPSFSANESRSMQLETMVDSEQPSQCEESAAAATRTPKTISIFMPDQQLSLLDLTLQNPTDRAHFPCHLPMSAQLRDQILSNGPCRPTGPFPLNKEFGRRTFSMKHYHAQVGSITVERLWLCFSAILEKPYCQYCWLFSNPSSSQKEWIEGVPGNPKNFGEKIKLHEKTQTHHHSSGAFGRWKRGYRLDMENEKIIQKETTFWRQVLLRIINIIMTLSSMSLAFRGHHEYIGSGDCHGGNFLALVAMQARFDPILQDLLRTPARQVKYLSPKIQNELIQLISNSLRKHLISRIQACQFYSIIVDTTSDITRTDQISIVVRWVCIAGETITIKETFLAFVNTTDATAAGLASCVSKWLTYHGIDLTKMRGQGYDGASVMSGNISGMQTLMRDIIKTHRDDRVTVPIPFVHCASHNLNLVINDAAEATIEGIGFFGTIAELFNFFGRSLNRWAELALTENGVKKLKLKKLCATRWSSRIEAVRALKNRYADILKVLARISLTSKDCKERADAGGLKKRIENFNFIVCIVIWEQILTALHHVSQKLQATNIDLSASVRLLSAAQSELQFLRNSWESILLSASAMSKTWGVPPHFTQTRQRRTKGFHDELSSDTRLVDPMRAFQVEVFYKLVDMALNQLKGRFEGHQQVASAFNFLFPQNLVLLTDMELEAQAKSLQMLYASDLQPDLVSEVRSFRREFRTELKECQSVKDVLALLISSDMLSSMPEFGTACILFCTLPVTVSSAERSFSKLKLIKCYLRSSIAQERLDSLALISIEKEEAHSMDVDELVKTFAESKVRRKQF